MPETFELSYSKRTYQPKYYSLTKQYNSMMKKKERKGSTSEGSNKNIATDYIASLNQ